MHHMFTYSSCIQHIYVDIHIMIYTEAFLLKENVVLDGQLCCKLADFGAGRLGPSSGTFSFGHPAGRGPTERNGS